MKDLMAQEGLPFNNDRTMSYNSRLAQELAKWAEGKANGWAIHDALFRAYFVDGKNIADTEVLLNIVEKVGLPVAEAREVLTNRLFSLEVDADWRRCEEFGVTGVPTYAIDGSALVGAHPYETLEKFVRQSMHNLP